MANCGGVYFAISLMTSSHCGWLRLYLRYVGGDTAETLASDMKSKLAASARAAVAARTECILSRYDNADFAISRRIVWGFSIDCDRQLLSAALEFLSVHDDSLFRPLLSSSV